MMQHQLTLGSLFDGIGGFPFAGEIAGIKPVWAAEVEPLCVAVTKRHFPDMMHFGDVTKLNGADLPPVDIITFGSPCQDLSVAGQRKGLKHEKNGDSETTRSGLFFRCHQNYLRNAGGNQWTISNFHCLGKRTRSIHQPFWARL